MCRNLPVVIRSMMETAVSASPQVATSRVMTCASRLVNASAPNSANARTMSRSDKMPITRRSAPSTTTAPIRCSANVAIYQKCVAEIVQRFGGFVAKYMGDGVLIYFGYPQAHEDDAERAVRAGLELIAAVTALK